jgi:cysteinyl-tRNA synthetase
MKLHNTLTRKVEEFTPLKEGVVSFYSCGPTVYDHAHIGNLSSYIFADTLRRVLSDAGYRVQHVMNLTDVDDKTVARSQREHPDLAAAEALRALTQHYENLFQSDMTRLGNDTFAITFVRATDNIETMQQLIQELHAKGFAYVTDDGVYFSIEAYRKSGKTYGQLVELTAENTSQARINNDEYDKDSIHDFALWKKQKGNEPAWELELNGQNLIGRPGWHLECSAMSASNLGQPFDIHSGGVDLMFPHHENEIAQSTAGKDNPLYAKYFSHNEHLLVDGKKMSKSLNNFYTLESLVEKGIDPLVFRLLVLQSHYRSQSNFTWESLDGAKHRLQAYLDMADQQFQTTGDGLVGEEQIKQAKEQIQSCLANDLNTPAALAALSQLEAASDTGGINATAHAVYTDFLKWLDSVLGLSLSVRSDITDEQKSLLGDREAARQNKEWEKSDELRATLLNQGIGLRDTPRGAIWFRT